MKWYDKILVGLPFAFFAAVLAGSIYAGIKKQNMQQETILKNEPAILQSIKKNSPFAEPVSAPLPNKERTEKWYYDYAFAPLDNDIVYAQGDNLYLAKNKERKQAQKIAQNIRLNQKYIFAADIEGKGRKDIYWIDWDLSLRKLRNDKIGFADEGAVLSLKQYFKTLPEHIEIGDINADKLLDIVYEGQIDIAGAKRNAIKALVGTKDKKLEEKIVYYLGINSLGGLIARDVDNDGDSDLIFKLKGDEKNLFGLENKTKQSSNPAVFQNGFREKVEKDDEFNDFFLYWFFFVPGGPGHEMIFDDD